MPNDARVDARRLGATLAAYREAAGLTQQNLADETLRERSGVAKIEGGHRDPELVWWAQADRVCRAEGALLEAYFETEAARAEERHATARATRAPVTGPDGGLALSSLSELLAGAGLTADEAEDAAELVRILLRWRGSVRRRTLMQVLAAVLAAVVPDGDALDPDEQERVTRAVAAPRRVDARVIEDMQTMLSAARRQEDRYGPAWVLGTVGAQRDLAHSLLVGCPALLRPRLLTTYAALCATAGGHYVDMGQYARARQCMTEGHSAAREAGDAAQACYLACQDSFLGALTRDASSAHHWANVAQSMAPRTDDGRLCALAHQMTAAAHAAGDDHRGCMRACESGYHALTSAASDSDSPAYWLDLGMLYSQTTAYLLRLGRFADAERTASLAYAHIGPGYIGGRALLSVRAATARLGSGQIDGAAEALADAARLASQSPSPRLARGIETTRAQMRRWEDTPAVATLDDRLAAHGFVIGR